MPVDCKSVLLTEIAHHVMYVIYTKYIHLNLSLLHMRADTTIEDAYEREQLIHFLKLYLFLFIFLCVLTCQMRS